MRIAQVHNAYQIAGGEDKVVELEHDMLVARGHRVSRYQVTNDGIVGYGQKAATFLATAYNPGARSTFRVWLAQERPDVVHVHNFFPRLSPSIYDACADENIAVVQTLHNFRTLCAGALMLREGQFCDRCVGRLLPYPAVVHRCYRGSLPGSLAVAAMITGYRRQRHRVHRFIALNGFSRQMFIRAGIPAGRIVTKPNGVPDPGPAPEEIEPRTGGLFVGRLSPEKGIAQLLRAWSAIARPLDIVGTGPLLAQLKGEAPASAVFHGLVDSATVRQRMWRSAFLVAPSLSEQFPMALVEAFSCGLPVITSRTEALAEIVTDGKTGLLCEPGDVEDLRAKVTWAIGHPEAMAAMGRAARVAYEQRYSEARNYEMLAGILEAAIAEARNGIGRS